MYCLTDEALGSAGQGAGQPPFPIDDCHETLGDVAGQQERRAKLRGEDNGNHVCFGHNPIHLCTVLQTKLWEVLREVQNKGSGPS